jgi:hypothetical protein
MKKGGVGQKVTVLHETQNNYKKGNIKNKYK